MVLLRNVVIGSDVSVRSMGETFIVAIALAVARRISGAFDMTHNRAGDKLSVHRHAHHVGGEDALGTSHVIHVGNNAEPVNLVGNFMERIIAVVISAKAGVGSTRSQVIVGPGTHFKIVVAAGLSRIDFVDGAAVSSRVEVAAGAG